MTTKHCRTEPQHCLLASVSRRADLQCLADRLDSVSGAILVDKIVQDFSRKRGAQARRDEELAPQSDRGSQHVGIRYTKRLADASVEPSVGSKCDSYATAMAETINGLYKAELIHRRASVKTKESVELATLEGVSWPHHLVEPVGYIPPAGAEANYCRQLASQATGGLT